MVKSKILILMMSLFLVSCVGTIEDNGEVDKSTVNDPVQDFAFSGIESGLWVSNTKASVRFRPAVGGSGNFRYQLQDEGGNVLTADNGGNMVKDSNGLYHLTTSGFPSGTTHRLLVRAIDIDRDVADTNSIYYEINLPSDLYPDFDGIDRCEPFPGGNGQNQLNVFWNKGGIYPNGLFGNLPHSVGSYRIYYCEKSEGTDCLETSSPQRGVMTILNATQEQATVAGLSANTDYYFRVTAVTEGDPADPTSQLEENNIEFSECKTQIASGPIVFSGIEDVILANGENGINEATAHWSPATGGYVGYKLFYHPVIDANSTFNYLDPNIQSITILDPLAISQAMIGLDSFTYHAFLMKACPDLIGDPTCGAGNDANGTFIIKQTKPPIAVFAGIDNATNDVTNPSNVYLNFVPADTSTGGIFDEYRVIISDGTNDYDITDSNATNKLGDIYGAAGPDYADLYLDGFVPSNITSTFAKLNGLKPGVIYQADVQAWVDRTSPLPISGGNISIEYGSQTTVPVAVSNDDTTPPLAAGMTVTPPSGILVENDVLTLVLTYNESLVITGQPRIGIDVGGVTKYADMVSNTLNSLTFEYTVVAGDNDLDGIAFDTNAVSLNGGSIADLSGNNANLNFVGVAPVVSAIFVDTTPPNPPTNITFSKPWLSSVIIDQTATWTNPTSDFSFAEIGVGSAGSGVANAVAFTTASSTNTHAFPNINASLTECFQEYQVVVRSVDAAGLKSSIASSIATFKYDATAPQTPTTSLIGNTSDIFVANEASWTAVTDSCSLDHYEIAIGRDDDADGFGSDDINNTLDWTEIPGGTATTQYKAQSGVDGMTFSLNAVDDFYVTIRAVDEAGNYSAPGSSAPWKVDIAGPSTPTNLAIATQWVSGALPVASPSVSWTNPTEPDFDHIEIALGTNIGDEDLEAMLNIGTFTSHTWTGLNSIVECNHNYPKILAYDDIGNPSIAATDPNVWFAHDNTAPTMTGGDIDISAGGEDLATNKAPLATWSSVTRTDNCNAIDHYELAIGYDDDADGFDVGDAENLMSFKTVPGGDITSQYQMVNGVDGFNFTLVAGFDYYISAKVYDKAGNVSTIFSASTPFSFAVDNTPPVPTITTTSPNPVNTPTFPITITFSEDVSGFTVSDLFINNGTASNFAGGPTVFTADISASNFGTVSVDIPLGAAQDAAGNPSTAATQFTIMYASTEPMKTVWQTSGANETITLPFVNGGTYDLLIDWGDGSPDSVVTSGNDPNRIHTYATAGSYTVTMYGIATHWRFNNGGDKLKIFSVTDLGDMGWVNLYGAFYGCSNLTSVSGGKTGNVTNMANMFRAAAIINPDTSSYDTSKVTTMHAMFYQSPFANPDTSGWDTSKVVSMAYMFGYAKAANPDTSGWDTSSVTDMYYLFYDAETANPDVSGWDVSKVTEFTGIFGNADVANPNVTNWNVSNGVNFTSMFYRAPVAQPNTSLWNTAKAVSMSNMFNGATVANPDTSGWDTSKVTTMLSMFAYAPAANPDTSGWDTSKVNNMQNMFLGATSANPDTSGWDTSLVTTMNQMFYNASSASPDTSGWNTAKVTNMNRMFRNATSANPNTSGWDTAKVTTMHEMFYNAVSVTPDTSGWDTSLVTKMRHMFYKCGSANPDTSGWNTANVNDMYGMFNRAGSANPDTSGWDTSKVTNMYTMFYKAGSANPDTSGWDVGLVTNFNYIFYQAYSLSNLNYSNFLIMVDNTTTMTNLITRSHSKYQPGAVAARNALIADGWNIVDLGPE